MRPTPLALALVLALAHPLPFPVPVAHADDGQSALNKGIERYGLADFKGSIRALEKAAATTTDPAALSRVHFYIGGNQGELKRPEEANAAFSRAVKLAPAMDPEPGAHKPAVIQTFRLARAAMVGLLRLRLAAGRLPHPAAARAGVRARRRRVERDVLRQRRAVPRP